MKENKHENKKLLFTLPNFISEADKKKLSANGILVIEIPDLKGLMFLNDLDITPVKINDVSLAAFEVISTPNYTNAQSDFAKLLLKKLIENQKKLNQP